MAETPSKRQREDVRLEDIEENKRHKSYNHILSLLEEEEDEPTQDLSSLITTLQQEISSDSIFDPLCYSRSQTDQENPIILATIPDDYASSSSSSACSTFLKEDEEDDKDRVMRHLLEASDDELGIPNRELASAEDSDEGGFLNGGDGFIAVDGFSLCDGLWEFEDVNANYYTMLQSELFM